MMKSRSSAQRRKLSFIGVLITFLVVPQLHAQEFRASVLGEVTDPSGAAIPSARVTAVQKSTERTYTTKSDTDGVYMLQYLPPGNYSVTVAAPGFEKKLYSNVTLESGQKLSLNVKLIVGSTHQQVTVTASPGLLNTTTASGGGVVDNAKVENLPTNWQNPFDEFVFIQGVRDVNNGIEENSTLRGGIPSYSADGAPGGNNAYYIDGSPVSILGASRLVPSQDAVQELQVSVAGGSEYGWMNGGAFDAALKSGTNKFHGDLYEYWSNQSLDANRIQNDVSGIPKTEDISNRFGGTLGGPIQKGRTFFFGSFDGWRQAEPIGAIESVPTPAMRQGDFAGTGYTVYNPATVHCVTFNKAGQCTTYNRDPFPGDIIPSGDINPIGQAIVNTYPLPNRPGDFNNYTVAGPRNLGYEQYLGRVDHDFSQSLRVYGLYIHEDDFSNSSGNDFPGPGSTMSQNPTDHDDAILDATKTFSQSLVGDFKVSFFRWVNGSIHDVAVAQNFTGDKLGGLQMPFVPTTTHQNIAPTIGLSGFTGIFGNTSSSSVENQWYFSPSFAQVIGRHTLHYGFQFNVIQEGNGGVPGQPNGTFSFDGQWSQLNPLKATKDSGLSVADLLLGNPSSGSLSWNQFNYITFHQYGLYFEDDYKVRRNLTLNLGLRWDGYSSPTERYNRINGQFCLTCTNPYTSQIDYAAYPNLPNPLTGGFLPVAANGQPRTAYGIAESNWQPRFGFAWAFTPKTVFRAGFGIYTDYGVNGTETYGFSQSTSYIGSLDNNLDPSGYFASGNPYPNGVLAPAGASEGLETNAGNGISYYSATRHIEWTQHWTADIQRALPWRTLLDVAYAGSHSHGLGVGQNQDVITTAEQQACFQDHAICNNSVPNPFYGVLPVATSLGSSKTLPAWDLMRPWPLFNGISLNGENGYSNYNALQVRVERKIRSLDYVFNYTYSNWMYANGYLNNGAYRDANLYYGPAGNDVRHLLTSTVVWPLPFGQGTDFFRSAHGLLGGLINHWLLDTMVDWHTGFPEGVPAANFVTGPGCTSFASPNGQTIQHWINNNPSCYQNLAQWQARTTPESLSWLRQPSQFQLDAALEKRFALPWEGKFLQTRIEATNATNTPQWGGPNLNNNAPENCSGVTCTGFGTIQPSDVSRIVTISMKLTF